ncbi:methyl-accepting chemotaxis protein [Acetobacterium wieringae]|uniref:methyl-accepting chemotaxis protein n=1 Tax=Acetobacterium wieringae TaxID=52694 RepID=UPI002B21A402|nr:methyl-accepting chemotaxis protein [Acetobacterium wieringae]MEA4807248.1 methyl-accepting chemotaxis protein [Acetobacterium wieringae]
MEKNHGRVGKWLKKKQMEDLFIRLLKQLLAFISILISVAMMLMVIVTHRFNLNSNEISVLLVTSLGIIIVALSMSYLFLKNRLKPLSELDKIICRISTFYPNKPKEKTATNKVEEMISKLNKFSEHFEMDVMNSIKKISEGNIDIDLQNRYSQSRISDELQYIAGSIEELYLEIDLIAKACQQGKLNTRGKADHFNGKYKEIINGVNRILDAITIPISSISGYVYHIGNGERP